MSDYQYHKALLCMADAGFRIQVMVEAEKDTKTTLISCFHKTEPSYLLTRREQYLVTVFRLRTGYSHLNYHLHSKLCIGHIGKYIFMCILTSNYYCSWWKRHYVLGSVFVRERSRKRVKELPNKASHSTSGKKNYYWHKGTLIQVREKLPIYFLFQ